MDRFIFYNGQILPEKEAKIHVYDSALMFGDVAFEMMRTFNGKTFKLDEHLDRLYNTCKILQIQMPYSQEELYKYHEDLLNAHKEDDNIIEWRTLINVTRGILPIYRKLLGVDYHCGTNVIITCFPLKYVHTTIGYVYDGIKCKVASQRAIPQYLLDARLKTRSRLHYKMAELEMPKDYWAILLDDSGYVAESTGSNIVILKGLTLKTPKYNCLQGISQKYVYSLWNEEKEYTNLTLHDLYTADEVFLTCTPFCIIPVVEINNIKIGNGRVGECTKYLMNIWSDAVNCDFVKQSADWITDRWL